MKDNKDIAIVGMSCYAPGATNIDEFWHNLVNGVDSIIDAPADRIDPRYFQDDIPAVDRFYCKRGGFVSDVSFDATKYSILPVAVEGMDTLHLLALKMVYQALEDAGVFAKNIPLQKAALIIGKGNYVGSAIWRAIDIVHVGEQITEVLKAALPDLSMEEIDKVKKSYQTSRGRYQADSMPGLIPNLIASLIANKLDMQGPAYTIDAACASSLIALEHSIKELQSGRCDIAIAGGVHNGQNATFWSIFSQLGALSHKQKITPFSEDADGLLISEGAGFVVLKKLDKAIADNDRIYAVIKGVGVSSDGAGVSVMAPAAKGQKTAIEEAWQNANLDKDKLGYLEVHGTATVVGDRTELSTISQVFPKKEGVNDILLGSVKSNIGHAMPAAGIFSLIKTSLALYNRQIPPTLHCENPLKEMKETRFRPVQKLERWDESKYPLVAGVNAFGFGGINAHVVLEAFGQKEETSLVETSPFSDKVIALSASNKEDLIAYLNGDKSPNDNSDNGNYRLVLFNPSKERIQKAINLISKDKPWKGRQDIWFTNEPLLKDGGKVAFLYPGFDPTSNSEIESVLQYFGFELPANDIESNPLLDHSMKLYRTSEAMNMSLAALGVRADMNVGHSLGEWFGIKASGIVTDSVVKNLLALLNPEDYHIEGAYFIAVGSGKERLNTLLETIPDLYLSNDNCPNQVLLCGSEAAINTLIKELQAQQIYYQILSFQSGFHTPFIKDKLNVLEEAFKVLSFQKGTIPMWSCTTLELYPESIEEIKALSVKHLLEKVRFREMIDKLYNQEGARMFVQLGSGSLVGFVDDTLSGKAYSAISTNTHLRSSLEQLRRVIALLYIEGKTVNLDFLNIQQQSQIQSEASKEVKLRMDMDIVTDFPMLRELSKVHNSPRLIDTSSLNVDTDHPVLRALNENLQEMTLIQAEITRLYNSRERSDTTRIAAPRRAVQLDQSIAQVQPISSPEANQIRKGMTFEEDLHISLKTHPTIMDHSLVKQPSHWTCIEDLNPVIPMTMTFELLGEAAHKQDLSKKVVKLGPISVFQWMEVHPPFIQTIKGVWKSEELISLGIKGFASGEVTLRDSYPEVDPYYESDIDLGENILPLISKEEIYKSYMFHGPSYQCIEEVTNITEKGIRTFIRRAEGKGSLLDNVGQTFGLYLHMTLDVNFISFPVKVNDITFYQDMNDQDGLFECICLKKSLTDEFASCEIIIKREGKLWCVIKGWQNRRFEFDDILWSMTLEPGQNMLAKEIAPNVFYYHKVYKKSYSWNFLEKRYLNQPEKKRYASLPLNTQKDYLISRVALKDSLRSYVFNKYGKSTYPIEYFIKYDELHKPYVYGIDEVDGVEVSIAHKGSESVSIVSDRPVGIDIESIAERTEGFMKEAYTDHELGLLKDRDVTEWSTRFWVAKEAYGKMLGLGLQGNPKRYEVKEIIDEDCVLIEDCKVKLLKQDNYIIGWTI